MGQGDAATMLSTQGSLNPLRQTPEFSGGSLGSPDSSQSGIESVLPGLLNQQGGSEQHPTSTQTLGFKEQFGSLTFGTVEQMPEQMGVTNLFSGLGSSGVIWGREQRNQQAINQQRDFLHELTNTSPAGSSEKRFSGQDAQNFSQAISPERRIDQESALKAVELRVAKLQQSLQIGNHPKIRVTAGEAALVGAHSEPVQQSWLKTMISGVSVDKLFLRRQAQLKAAQKPVSTPRGKQKWGLNLQDASSAQDRSDGAIGSAGFNISG